MRVQAFGFEKQLMRRLVRKFDDLVFDGRTVSWSDGLNLPAVHWRAMYVFANDAVRLFGRPCDVTGDLRIVVRNSFSAKTERRRIGVARLHLKL